MKSNYAGDELKAGGKSSFKQKIGDSIMIASVVIAVAFSIPLVTRESGTRADFAIVEVGGKESVRIVLGENGQDRIFEIKGFAGTSKIEVKNGRVRMLESACPDKLCIGMGWAEETGDSIVCVPNRVVIRLTGPDKSRKVDTVTE
ncbi:MAG: NusG domain II-containing protein [Actinobacteria bacterium]|nr:NusG domain II-containing protein [Actinomycetota bacterium]